MSLFVTFEGIEGCGKTTQIGLLKSFLEKKHYPFLITREPGGTEVGEQIRRILLLSENARMEPLAELFLYAAARVQHLHQVILPALREGRVVLCDRFSDATFAYQGYGRGLDLGWIEEIHKRAMEDIRPDITFLLDLSIEEGLKRAWKRSKNNKLSRFEKRAFDHGQQEFPLHFVNADQDRLERGETRDFHRRVREGYLVLARREPKRINLLDGMKDEQTLHQEILSRLAGLV